MKALRAYFSDLQVTLAMHLDELTDRFTHRERERDLVLAHIGEKIVGAIEANTRVVRGHLHFLQRSQSLVTCRACSVWDNDDYTKNHIIFYTPDTPACPKCGALNDLVCIPPPPVVPR